jgi:hypothetical protein
MYSVLYFTNKTHNISYTQILKAHLWHVSVQVYHLQVEHYASFKTNSHVQVVICKVFQPVAESFFTLIKKLENDSLTLTFVLRMAFRSP